MKGRLVCRIRVSFSNLSLCRGLGVVHEIKESCFILVSIEANNLRSTTTASIQSVIPGNKNAAVPNCKSVPKRIHYAYKFECKSDNLTTTIRFFFSFVNDLQTHDDGGAARRGRRVMWKYMKRKNQSGFSLKILVGVEAWKEYKNENLFLAFEPKR